MQTTKIIPLILVIMIFLLWITPGTLGRDLWKADEPYSFGLVNHIIKTGDWVVPTLTGEPFMEKPPLLYITGAGFVRVFSPWLQPHEAARVAVIFFMFLCALFLGLAAGELLGKTYVGITMIILIGATGLQETAHKLITDVAMLAGISLGLYGLALSRRQCLLGGLLLGTGAGIGFMSKGLLAPGMLGIIALLLPLFFSAWRRKNYLFTLLIACLSAVPWFVVWPLALYLRSPELFREWFWTQNIGRFTSNALVGQRNPAFYYLTQLPYFALPALPLALWAIWHARRSWHERTEIQLPLVAFLVMLLVLSLASSIRDIYALPMLLPLTLLAAAGAASVPDRAKSIISWFSVSAFGFIACVLWFGWAVMVTGFPSFLAQQLHQQQPDYMPTINGLLLLFASIYFLLWLFMATRSSRFENSYLIDWTVGIVLTWGLLMTLWLPWFEAGSGYRSLFASLREKIPAQSTYIMSWGLGESERALCEYYAGVVPRRIENNIAECDYVLVESGSTRIDPSLGPGWQSVWEQRRPSKPGKRTKEIFTLMQRGKGDRVCR